MRLLAAVAVMMFLLVNALDARAPETYAPRGGQFEVKFPDKPKESTTTADSKLGKLKVFTATHATTAGDVFMVSYTDFPENAAKPEHLDAILDGVRNGLKGKEGTILKDDAIKVGADELPGRELELERGKQRVRVHAVVRGDRLYQVGVIGTKEFVGSAEAKAFLKSFELKK